jgi:hypothetical protein
MPACWACRYPCCRPCISSLTCATGIVVVVVAAAALAESRANLEKQFAERTAAHSEHMKECFESDSKDLRAQIGELKEQLTRLREQLSSANEGKLCCCVPSFSVPLLQAVSLWTLKLPSALTSRPWSCHFRLHDCCCRSCFKFAVGKVRLLSVVCLSCCWCLL